MAMHNDLRRDLVARGLRPAVYCCGYDFRQDNATSAARLNQVVVEAQSDCENERVIIIAHSMGGLVARHFLRNLGGEARTRALILLGSPSLGAHGAFINMRNGLPFSYTVRLVLRVGAEATRQLMMRMQSVYQLLPNQHYCGAVRTNWATFDPSQTGWNATVVGGTPSQIPAMMSTDNSNSMLFYLDIYTGVRAALDTRPGAGTNLGSATRFHAGLMASSHPYMHPRTVCYYSGGLNTPGSARIDHRGQVVRGSDLEVVSAVHQGDVRGDGTVPTDSAMPAGPSHPFFAMRDFGGVVHVSLSSNAPCKTP